MATKISILITAIMAMQMAFPATAGFLDDLAKGINKGIDQALSTSSGSQTQDNTNQQQAQAEIPQDLDKLKRRIDVMKRSMPAVPVYLYSVDTTSDAIATVWLDLTDKLVSDGARRARYDEFFYTSLDYRNLAQIALGRAEKAVNRNDAWRTGQQLQLVDRYLKLHNLTRDGATALYLGHIDEAYDYAKAIYDMSQSLVKLGSAAGKPIIGPYAGYTFDLLFLATDYMIDEAYSGIDEAARKAAMKVLVKVAFDAVPLKTLNGKTIGQFMTDKTGSYIGKGIATSRRHPIIDELLVSPEFIRAFRSALAKSASHLTEDQVKKIATATLNGVWQQLGESTGNTTVQITTKGTGFGMGSGGGDEIQENKILQYKIVSQTEDEAIFDVDYLYTGDHGKVDVVMYVMAYANGRRVENYGYTQALVVPGKNTARVKFTNSIPSKPFTTNEIAFILHSFPHNKAFAEKRYPFAKHWGYPDIPANIIIERVKEPNHKGVRVVVPNNYNLLDEQTLHMIYRAAIPYGRSESNMGPQHAGTIIKIYQNDELAVETYTGNTTAASINEAFNAAKGQERHYLRGRIEKANAAQAHSKQVSDSRRRFDEFTKKHGTSDFISASKLDANPFVFEGDNILLRARFREMVSKTDGLIESENRGFILSDIPRARFTDSGPVLVVAKVIGKKQGMTTIKYLDARTCGDYSCKEYLLWRE